MNTSLKILCIGNSFSVDTTRFVSEIALRSGYEKVKIANLYIGGCPICKHYENLMGDKPLYRFDQDVGRGWEMTYRVSIRQAVESDEWDWISIQHGSSQGNCYTEKECYSELAPLVKKVKEMAGQKTKIAFNMAWAPEAEYSHHELVNKFSGDAVKMYEEICKITENLVQKIAEIDVISPTGTAVQNARGTHLCKFLNRDGFHLSYDFGRYLAGIVFFMALTKREVFPADRIPGDACPEDQKLLLQCAEKAIQRPFSVTRL